MLGIEPRILLVCGRHCTRGSTSPILNSVMYCLTGTEIQMYVFTWKLIVKLFHMCISLMFFFLKCKVLLFNVCSTHVHTTVHIWRSENNFWSGSLLPRAQMKSKWLGLDSKSFYLLRHHANLLFFWFEVGSSYLAETSLELVI